MRMALLLFLFILCASAQPLRFGITSVAIKDDLFAVREWANFLEQKSGLEIQVVFAKNYDEIRYLLENGGVDFAYVCGATYIETKESAPIEVLALPFVYQEATYESLVIAAANSPFESLLDFENAHYAFSDPRSNSGAIVPIYTLREAGYNYRHFFKRVIYTYDHAESIQAVAEGFVDGASVDSIVYENFRNIHPQIADRVRVVERFGPFTTTPIVVRQSVDRAHRNALLLALEQMSQDPQGRKILERFGIERFAKPEHYNYDEISEMIQRIRGSVWE